MARKRRNCRTAVKKACVRVGKIEGWSPPDGLMAFLRKTLEGEGIVVDDDALVDFRHFRAIQQGNRVWGSWLIVKIIKETAPELNGLKSLIKEISTPEALEGLKGEMGKLSRDDLFEVLVGIETREYNLERVVAQILIENKKKKEMKPRQILAIIKNLRGDKEAFFWAIEKSGLDQRTKDMLVNPLSPHLGKKQTSFRPYGGG